MLRAAMFLLSLLLCTVTASAQSLTIWANEGGDKVTRDELRGSRDPSSVLNSTWDGQKVKLFGAKNEVLGANFIIESPTAQANGLSVTFNRLTGPGGATISSKTVSGDGIFDWVGRDIEVFYLRYLQIKGISPRAYDFYDERHIPKRMQRPWQGNGFGQGLWTDRPDHDKYYPDIAVPIELVPTFSIDAGSNQSIWVDVYVPKTATPGLYTGTFTVRSGATILKSVPVELTVRNFTLPDEPSAKTMVYYSPENLSYRYQGQRYVRTLDPEGQLSVLIRNRHFQVAHRHRTAIFDGNYDYNGDQPSPNEWIERLNGSLFTPAYGYSGPGTGVGNGVFAIGTYNTWRWRGGTEADMRQHTDAWESWFQSNFPNTERFLYLADETRDFAQLETWAGWMKNNPGIGRALKSMAAIDLPNALSFVPSLDIVASVLYVRDFATWENASNQWRSKPGRELFMYNGNRPATGTLATEDDGVSPRVVAWTQYKKNVHRWFQWESTYYNNYQGGAGETNVFQTAHTFGGTGVFDPVRGQTSYTYGNGDGVLFYPGTDKIFPADSYGVNGPLASLRLKLWRRGIQDVDYLTLASKIDPAAVQSMVATMVPKVLWEYGVEDPADPTYKRTDISWSINPDTWEAARRRLADIIEQGSQPLPTIPAAPANLTASIEQGKVRLRWEDRSSNEDGFLVERAIGSGSFQPLADIFQNSITHLDVGVLAGNSYAYRLRSYNSAGSSATSNTVSITVPGVNPTATPTPTPGAATLPKAPSGLQATVRSGNQIDLSWTDNSSNETGFKIEMSTNGTTWGTQGSVGANVTSFSVSRLTPLTSYTFRVASYNGVGTSTPSSTVSATTSSTTSTPPPTATPMATATPMPSSTPTRAPTATPTSTPTPVGTSATTFPRSPSSLQAVVRSSSQIDLTWVDNATNESGFSISISANGGAWGTVTRLPVNTTSYSLTGLKPSTLYRIRVDAYNAVGTSSPASAEATTPAISATPVATATPTRTPTPTLTPTPTPTRTPTPATVSLQAPGNVRAVGISTSAIALTWEDRSSGEQGYYIDATYDSVNFFRVATLPANSTSHTATNLNAWTGYGFRVVAFSGTSTAAAPLAYGTTFAR